MPNDTTFESFEKELNRLVDSFGKRLAELKTTEYNEAKLRDDFLNPFFRALGWDMENRAGLIQKEREVEIESATHIGGGRKRADYLFRVEKRDRFVCEAKKPAEELHARYAFQAKRYAWNKGVPVAVLTDFEETKIFIVGGKPHIDEPAVGEWKSWSFRQYPLIARELWDLLARDRIAAGSIDLALEALPKKATSTGKARQQWLIKPDRTRALDNAFLEYLDDTRRELASDIYKNNDHDELNEGNKLTDACQRIIDRILFLRICEDRDIDTGTTLQSIVETWRKNTGNDDTGRRATQHPLQLREEPPADSGSSGIRAPKDSLWRAVVRHFRALDRRPPTHVPFFNGNLFKSHFTESLIIGDEWLAGFIGELSADESPYLFSEIPVEILGSVYERFLGKVVILKGRGISVEEKLEVRKAGGVYYTPRYIVEYIVEQTAGKLLDEIAAEKEDDGLKAFRTRTEKLHLLDPACGSGSFLIRAFERVCEHWLKRLTADLRAALGVRGHDRALKLADLSASEKNTRAAWEKKYRPLCWVDAETGDVHLTVALKRQILTQNIYGVDLDAAAVEVTQLSLYLKMLENENRTTLKRQRELLSDETEIALLPPLQDNIKRGNSLIASDFSMMPEDLIRVHAFDWNVGFKNIIQSGGFDAVMGNPPYIQLSMEEFRDDQANAYLKESFGMSGGRLNTFILFIEKARRLTKNSGEFGFIVPNTLLTQEYYEEARQRLVQNTWIQLLVSPMEQVFSDAVVENVILIAQAVTTKPKDGDYKSIFANLSERGLDGVQEVRQSEFALNFRTSFVVPSDPKLSALKSKLNNQPFKFEDLLNINQAIALKHDRAACLTDRPISKQHHEILDGRHIGRYFTGDSPNYFKFDIAKIHSCKREDIFLLPEKIFMRRVGDSLIGTLDDKQKFALNTLVVLTPLEDCEYKLKFMLGIFNSRLMNFFYTRFLKSTKKVFSEIQARQVGQLPVPKLDLKKAADKSRHDKLVSLVDKMLGLMPKLRAATLDSEKAVLQNAVTATDHQIDALVYELYNLTPEEIQLVEGNT